MKITRNRTLQQRLLVAFLTVGIVPYLLILLYFSYWGRNAMEHQQRSHYQQQIEQSRQLIQNRIAQLERDMDFLSRLTLFDDMVVGDLDYRIAALLEQKSQLGEEGVLHLYAIIPSGTIVAASNALLRGKHLELQHIESSADVQIQNGALILKRPLRASFDATRTLGFLVAEYPLTNLNQFLLQDTPESYRMMKEGTLIFGKMPSVGRSLEMLLPFSGSLQGVQLIYSVDERGAVAFINRFLFYLTLLLVTGIVAIVVVSRQLARQIVAPIASLSRTASRIVATGDYSLRMERGGFYESVILADLFNRLVATTEDALDTLLQENQFRMQRFVDLTDMFNHITTIVDEQECLDASLKKLEALTTQHVTFAAASFPERMQKASVPMYITDFEKNSPVYYGNLVIEKERFDDAYEERFFSSIAAMIMLQIERIALTNRLAQASEAKSAFISGMSHELRTPLNAIIGFSQYLIAYEELEEEQLESVAKIERAAMHLLLLINDILDIARIEAGKMEVHCSDVLLKSVIEECLELMQPLAEDKGLYLKCEHAPMPDFIISTDAKILKQILINLLSNAIKFTEKGGVAIDVASAPHHVRIDVTDSGVGIPPERIEELFGEFVQLRDETSDTIKGSGLGLALSRKLAGVIGGTLKLESPGVGAGSRATLEITF